MIVKSENVRNGHYVMNELESVLKELFPSVLEGFDVDEMVDVVLNRLSEVFDLFSSHQTVSILLASVKIFAKPAVQVIAARSS